MRSDVIIDVMMAKVKSNLQNHSETLNAELTAENESKRQVLLEAENGADEVYRSLLYFQKSYRYPKARRESLAREIKFFRNNKSRMEYKRCIAGRIAPLNDNGWPIGSGVILCHQRNKLRRARVW